MLNLFSKINPRSRANLVFGILIFALVPKVTVAQSLDEPDLKKENQFHQIYKAYNESPTSEQSWSGAASGKAQTYQVQKGDTLWDLSTTLFGEPDFWPKVWSLNSENVQNPHEILPSQKIQFFPGTLGEAPLLTLADGSSAGTTNTVLVPNDNPADLPERLRNPAPVAKIPRSFPDWGFREEKKVQTDLEFTRRKPIPAAQESMPYYVADGIQSLGRVVEMESGGKTGADYQYAFVELNGPNAEKNVLAAKDLGEISDKIDGGSARLIEAQGEIEILEVVNPEKNLYRALIKRALVPIEVGALLVAGKIPTFNANPTDSISQGMARVIGGEFAIRREILANRGILFLSGTGLDVGQVYPIFKVHQQRVPGSVVKLNDRQIGKVKIIQVSGKFATAVVIDSKEDIQIGDITNPDVRIR